MYHVSCAFVVSKLLFPRALNVSSLLDPHIGTYFTPTGRVTVENRWRVHIVVSGHHRRIGTNWDDRPNAPAAVETLF